MVGQKNTCSSRGKDILVKAVLQAMPTYGMGIFKFPTSLLEELDKLIRNFWWGDKHEMKRMHWVSWESYKTEVSWWSGFRNLCVFNQALLAEQAWRLIHITESLCARLLKARNYPAGNLLDTAFVQNS
jgi:hypothetical protein